MGEIRDFFIRTLDDSASGIGAMMERLMANLRHHDHQLWNRLRVQELRPQFFSFRYVGLFILWKFCIVSSQLYPYYFWSTLLFFISFGFSWTFVSPRWLTLMLSQEFDLPDVIRVWDSLFADADRFTYLIQVCTAMMVWVFTKHRGKYLSNYLYLKSVAHFCMNI